MKKLYSKFLEANKGALHFAAHSHHFWPDASLKGHTQYWLDSAEFADLKWDKFFGEIFPKFQKHVARILGLKKHERIVFGENTHEFVLRIFSLFDAKKKIRVLTTGSEFHSFRRQLERMQEAGMVEVTRISTEKLLTDRSGFLQDFTNAIRAGHDLVFFSQVFFDSGLALSSDELAALAAAAPKDCIVCIDGYHAFAAIPVDLSKIEGRVFYLGGGYKYAQAGEGACFLSVPDGNWRPVNTGWFAEIASLSESKNGGVAYPEGGLALAGSTQDFSGIYRFNAVWDEFKTQNISVESIHKHVAALQDEFAANAKIEGARLIRDSSAKQHAHFLAYDLGSENRAQNYVAELGSKNVIVDSRGTRVRFGFGTYHDLADVKTLLARV